MKQMLLTIFITLFAFSFVKAQTFEVVSELKPIPKKVKKFSKKSPKMSYSIIDETNVEFTAKIDFVNLPNNKKGIAVIVETTNYEFAFQPIGDKLVAKIYVYGRIISEDKRTNGYFEETINVEMNKNDSEKLEKNPITFRKVFALSEGIYKIGIVVRDLQTGYSGIRLIKFQINAAK